VETATADKGYFETPEIKALQVEGIKTVICDPVANRRLDKLEAQDCKAVKAARRSAKSKYGKALLKRRGMHLERAFAHILDCGGMRRATLRGLVNLNKRFKLAAAFYNLSQLMRQLFGTGTPGQWEAGKARGWGTFSWGLVVFGCTMAGNPPGNGHGCAPVPTNPQPALPRTSRMSATL
jgi:hypothetical protein